MDFLLQQLASLKASHPVFFVMILVPLVTGLLNIGIWFATSPRWTELVGKYPRLAAVFQLLDAVGLSPVKVLIRLYTIFTGNPWTPPPVSEAKKLAIKISGGAMLLAVVMSIGCSWLTPRHVQDVASITECVLAAAEAPEPPPPVQIAEKCGLENAQEVIDLLKVEKAAMSREKASLCGPSPSSSKP